MYTFSLRNAANHFPKWLNQFTLSLVGVIKAGEKGEKKKTFGAPSPGTAWTSELLGREPTRWYFAFRHSSLPQLLLMSHHRGGKTETSDSSHGRCPLGLWSW